MITQVKVKIREDIPLLATKPIPSLLRYVVFAESKAANRGKVLSMRPVEHPGFEDFYCYQDNYYHKDWLEFIDNYEPIVDDVVMEENDY